jgi:hypothetical protein
MINFLQKVSRRAWFAFLFFTLTLAVFNPLGRSVQAQSLTTAVDPDVVLLSPAVTGPAERGLIELSAESNAAPETAGFEVAGPAGVERFSVSKVPAFGPYRFSYQGWDTTDAARWPAGDYRITAWVEVSDPNASINAGLMEVFSQNPVTVTLPPATSSTPKVQLELEPPPSQVSGDVVFTVYGNHDAVEIDFVIRNDQEVEQDSVGGSYSGPVNRNGTTWHRWKSAPVSTGNWPSGRYHLQVIGYPAGSTQTVMTTSAVFEVNNSTSQSVKFIWEAPQQIRQINSVSGNFGLTVKTDPVVSGLEFEFFTPSQTKVRQSAWTNPEAEPGVFRYDWGTDSGQWADGEYAILPLLTADPEVSGPVRYVTVDNSAPAKPLGVEIRLPTSAGPLGSSLQVRAQLTGTVTDELCLIELQRADSAGAWQTVSGNNIVPDSFNVCEQSFKTSTLADGSYRVLVSAIPGPGEEPLVQAALDGFSRTSLPPETEPDLVVGLLKPAASATVSGDVEMLAQTNYPATSVQVSIRSKLSLDNSYSNQTSLMLTPGGSATSGGVTIYNWSGRWNSKSSGLGDGEYVIKLTATGKDQTAVSEPIAVTLDNIPAIEEPPPTTTYDIKLVSPTETEVPGPFSGSIKLAAAANPQPDQVIFKPSRLPDSSFSSGPAVAPLSAQYNSVTQLWEAEWPTTAALDGTYKLTATALVGGSPMADSPSLTLDVLHPEAPFSVSLGDIPTEVSGTVTLRAVTSTAAGQLKFEVLYPEANTATTVAGVAQTVPAVSSDGQLWVGSWNTAEVNNGPVVVKALANAGSEFAADEQETVVQNSTDPGTALPVSVTVTKPEPNQWINSQFRLTAEIDQPVGNLIFILVHQGTNQRTAPRASADTTGLFWHATVNADGQRLANGPYTIEARAFNGSQKVGQSASQVFEVRNFLPPPPKDDPVVTPDPVLPDDPTPDPVLPEPKPEPKPEPVPPTPEDPNQPEPKPDSPDSGSVLPASFAQLLPPQPTLTGDVRLIAVTSQDVRELQFLIFNQENRPISLEGKPAGVLDASAPLESLPELSLPLSLGDTDQTPAVQGWRPAQLRTTAFDSTLSETLKSQVQDSARELTGTAAEQRQLWTAVWQTRRHGNGDYRLTVQAIDRSGNRLSRPEPIVRPVNNRISQPSEEVNLREIVISDPEAVRDSVWAQSDPDRRIVPVELPPEFRPPERPEAGQPEPSGSMPDRPDPDGEPGMPPGDPDTPPGEPNQPGDRPEAPTEAEPVDWRQYPPQHPDCVANGIAVERCEQWLAYQNRRAQDSRCLRLGITIKEECVGYLQQLQTGELTQEEIAKETAGLVTQKRFDSVQAKMFSLVGRTIDLRVRAEAAGGMPGAASAAGEAADQTGDPDRPPAPRFAQPALDPFEEELRASLGEDEFDREAAELELGEFIPLKAKRDRKIRLHGSPAYVENSEGLVQSQMPALVMLDDDGDGLPNDTELRLGTDPLMVDTDGDGYGDWQELRNGFDPLKPAAKLADSSSRVKPVDAAIISGLPLDQPRTAGPVDRSLKVDQVEFFADATVAGAPALRLQGQAKPGETVTIYVYSYLPLVLTTTAKEDGTWSYDLADGITDGQHEVYVAVTDDTGRIQGKSEPLGFLVAEARAATEDEYFSPTVLAAAEAPVNRFMVWYLVGAGILILGGAVIGGMIFTRSMQRHSGNL